MKTTLTCFIISTAFCFLSCKSHGQQKISEPVPAQEDKTNQVALFITGKEFVAANERTEILKNISAFEKQHPAASRDAVIYFIDDNSLQVRSTEFLRKTTAR